MSDSTTPEETPTVSPSAIERRVRRLEDAHVSMEKSILGLGTQIALAEAEQRHTRELMDSRFTGVESTLSLLGGKVDTLTSLLQANATDPGASVINREVEKRLFALEEKTKSHDNIIQQALGASRVFKVGVTVLSIVGVVLAVLNTLHIIGVIK